ncbi:MAG TPA: hypothetical protein VK858_10635 [Longimicrobiales bacterium]|nr:hypothetical protein [Longimicrobiales bacterium]
MTVRTAPRAILLRFLGEFAVIVVGVLVALAIDSWANDQALRSEEADAKRLLHAEFTSNLARLDTARMEHERTLDAGYTLLSLMHGDGGPGDVDVSPDLVWAFVSTWTYDPVMGGLNSLIQSGRLGILRDDTLRVALAGWPDIVADLRENEEEEWRFTFQVLNPFLVERGLAEELFTGAGRLPRLDPPPRSPDLRSLLEDEELRHLYAIRVMNLHIVLDEIRSVEESIHVILELLDSPRDTGT